MSMGDVFQELDNAIEAIEPGMISRIRNETIKLKEFSATTGFVADRLLQGVNVTETKTNDYLASVDAFNEQADKSSRHIGAAIIGIGGEPNELLMQALDHTHAARGTADLLGQAYIEQRAKLLEAVPLITQLQEILAGVAMRGDAMLEDVDTLLEQRRAAGMDIMLYEQQVGRAPRHTD